MNITLTIAGSDSSSGAGIQQDLKVFSSLGVYGVSVITAITAQNTRGVREIYPLYPDIISAQIDAILSDIKVDAIKTGMLANREIASLIYEKIKKYKIKNLVVDPVMKSTFGHSLLDEDAIQVLKKLISIATITTPNVSEAEILSGVKIHSEEDMREAAKQIVCKAVIITGGDLRGRDLFYYNNEFQVLKSNLKIKEKIHGTGCGFSSAITANLAKGANILEAVKKAKRFINCSLARNFSISSNKRGGLRIADTSKLMMHKDFQHDEEKRKVVESVSNAIRLFCSSSHSWKLIPEVGINIAMALPKAKNLSQVAGLTGRIVRDRDIATPVGIVNFHGSSHVGRIVLTVMKFDKKKRAAMNIKFSEKILEICKEMNLKISTFEREKEPDDRKTMEWGTKVAIEKNGGVVPNIIYDQGGKRKEAMMRILGKSAEEVVGIAVKIVEKM
jgi:hydroxymethylpyrimidine/phosphomethylpyrimidine kinase